MKSLAFLTVVAVLPLSAALAGAAEPAPTPQALEFFEKQVRPVLVEHCQGCHGSEKKRGGLRLDSKSAFLKGGAGGPVVVPGQPEKSPLVLAVRHKGELKMPPSRPLDEKTVAVLTEWVRLGAPWPDDSGVDTGRPRNVAEVRASHWSFRPVRKPTPPTVKDAARVRTPIDAFILAGLEAKGLTLAPEADRRTLLRRVTFDLTGLPPTPEEAADFLADKAPNAYEKVVDRLLASPAYGEKWGRHWLDVARYADSKGYVFQEERRYPYSYTYRDYVIRSFNEDLPYDRFVVEQLAADRLPPGDDKRPLAAMGFLTLGRRFLNNQHDIIDDRIDVTMRGLQGLTVSCARCHDHKFDPVPQKDYYSLYGVFASSVEPADLPLIGEPQRTEAYKVYEAELIKRQDAVKKFEEENRAELMANNRKFRDQLKALQKKVEEWKVTSPESPPRAMVLNDRPNPVNPRVFNRGNPNNPGDAVPRQYLEVVAEKRTPFRDGSGRLELAKAIASADNPLTARVLVNRVWAWHFGQGIVRTPSDFGTRGELPTHPELLDWLAATFVEDGWSVKKLHRRIVLSAVYRQASDNPKATAVDADNRLLGRMNRHRLDFEELRDALLSSAGRLDRTMGGKAVELTTPPFPTRRTVYGFIDRQNLPGMFRTFDFASPDASTPQRFTTTVPQQALFLLNSPFVAEQARALVSRPDVTGLKTDEERIDRLYRICFGRAAEKDEVALGLRFLLAEKAAQPQTPSGHLNAWEKYAQVLLLSNEFAFVD
jgi:hypothetical protein